MHKKYALGLCMTLFIFGIGCEKSINKDKIPNAKETQPNTNSFPSEERQSTLSDLANDDSKEDQLDAGTISVEQSKIETSENRFRELIHVVSKLKGDSPEQIVAQEKFIKSYEGQSVELTGYIDHLSQSFYEGTETGNLKLLPITTENKQKIDLIFQSKKPQYVGWSLILLPNYALSSDLIAQITKKTNKNTVHGNSTDGSATYFFPTSLRVTIKATFDEVRPDAPGGPIILSTTGAKLVSFN